MKNFLVNNSNNRLTKLFNNCINSSNSNNNKIVMIIKILIRKNKVILIFSIKVVVIYMPNLNLL